MQVKVKRRGLMARWKECSQPQFAPFCHESSMDAQSVDEAKNVLQLGSDLWKVKGFSSWYRRRYFVDPDKQRIVCEGSNSYSCFRSNETIKIKDIHDVRQGWRTDVFNKIAREIEKKLKKRPEADPAIHQERCFSIVHGRKYKTLDIVCTDHEVCNAWVRGLSHWVAVQRNSKREDAWKTWLKDQFQQADIDGSGGLNFEECQGLLTQLNIEMSAEHTRRLFNEANTIKSKVNGEDVLDATEFVIFHNLLRKRPELESLFHTYTCSVQLMVPSQLLNFLQQEQNMSHLAVEDAIEIIECNEPQTRKEAGFLSIDGFRWFLRSKAMDIFNIEHRRVYQDMDQPLSNYYIASSHNTYLIADQFIGDSSVEGYIEAFKQGCRCVELDLWDGSDGEPVITHGYTATTKILLKDVLRDAIKPYAFKVSPYPVILSFENHLSVDQQKVTAKHLQNILGDMLYKKSLTPDMKHWPSPNELQNKIIIKGKKNPDYHPSNAVELKPHTTDCDHDADSLKKSKLAPELSNLVNLCQAVKFDDLKTTIQKGRFHDCSSLVESKALSLATATLNEFAEASQKQIFRIYPTGTRVDSSNYDPIPMWNAGCQLVALNYQTNDEAMDFNWAKFRANGKCGLVLKPKYLTSGKFDFEKELSFSKKLSIKVISGQHIPKPNQSATGEIVDPYVTIEVKGHPRDVNMARTKFVRNNGFNPIWNEVFQFTLRFPELAFVQFIVRDYEAAAKDEILGQFTIAYENIQAGYRHVHLVDSNHDELHPATLFVHVAIT